MGKILLLADIGNSAVKLALTPKDRFEVLKKKVLPAFGGNFFKTSPLRGDETFFASVNPALSKLFKKFYPEAREIKTADLLGVVKTEYGSPERLGVDRLLNALGSLKYSTSSVVVSAGTATVVDVVVNGIHKGGVIFPGLELSLKCLHERTGSLPPVEVKGEIPLFGSDTESAILSGTVLGWVAAVRGFVESFRNRFGIKTVVLTGGVFKRYPFLVDFLNLETETVYDENLTLYGLWKFITGRL